VNLPDRMRLSRTRKILIGISLSVLLGLPIYLKEWPIVLLLLVAVAISSFYSLVPPGFSRRIKDIPWLKWSAPPLVILVTLTMPAWSVPTNRPVLLAHWPLLGGIMAALLINILLFDQRDRLGDASAGLRTIANQLSPTNFSRVILFLLGLQITFLALDPQLEMMVFAGYLAILIVQARKKQPPHFYHWAVDGMLFVPLLVLEISRRL